MEKKFIVRDFESKMYYCGDEYGFRDTAYYAEFFNTMEEAENFIKSEQGKFIIETIYISL